MGVVCQSTIGVFNSGEEKFVHYFHVGLSGIHLNIVGAAVRLLV